MPFVSLWYCDVSRQIQILCRGASFMRIAATKARKAPARKAKSKPQKKSSYDPTAPERISKILHLLDESYPGVVCALHHNNAWELLVATILSAQCTDVRVNMVTP